MSCWILCLGFYNTEGKVSEHQLCFPLELRVTVQAHSHYCQEFRTSTDAAVRLPLPLLLSVWEIHSQLTGHHIPSTEPSNWQYRIDFFLWLAFVLPDVCPAFLSPVRGHRNLALLHAGQRLYHWTTAPSPSIEVWGSGILGFVCLFVWGDD